MLPDDLKNWHAPDAFLLQELRDNALWILLAILAACLIADILKLGAMK